MLHSTMEVRIVADERALLFTDVIDSTRLIERLGDARAAELWVAHDRKSRELLALYNVREINRTDGFFLVFDRAVDAASFALAYHAVLAELGMEARAGLHVGPVTLHENAPADVARGAKRVEVEGLATPIAARVMNLAQGRQTLLTAAARATLDESIPPDAEIKRHGYYRLKGVEEPVEIFEVGVRNVAPFLPPPDAEKAYRVIRAGDRWSPAREVRHNLPAERDVFVGRGAELCALAARFDNGSRLVTVLGPGGTGKTRLVRRFGWTFLGNWSGGVYFCDLSDARSLEGIFFAVAAALEVPLGRSEAAVQLGHAIAGRGHCMIILDNFEQVAQHATDTIGRWLDRAAEAVFAVTSRERLHLAGEDILTVEPLSLEHDAIELFAARARAQRAEFAVTDANRDSIRQVVRLLDGLPLAIELAAARVRLLSPAQLVNRLQDRFQLLGDTRGPAARQATLRTAIDWSWDLLTPWEQAALAQCSVFQGGFTLEAAESTLELSPWPQSPSAMDVVQSLLDKSLLRTWVPAEQSRYDIDEPYFGMYFSIHEYAAMKLASSTRDMRLTEERHGCYFARFGTTEALDGLKRHGGTRKRRALALELDNLVAACRRAVRRGDGETAATTYRAMWEILHFHGPYALAVDTGFDVLATRGLDTAQRGLAVFVHASALWRVGRVKEAITAFERALESARALGDRLREGVIIGNLGMMYEEQGKVLEAREYIETALLIAREVGNRPLEGTTLIKLGVLEREEGRTERARANYEDALAIFREIGNRLEEGVALSSLGNVNLEQGRIEEARASYEQSLAINREVGNRRDEGIAITNLGSLHRNQGQLPEARRHFETALAIARDLGDRRVEGAVLYNLGLVHQELGSIAEARQQYEAALANARAVNYPTGQGVVFGALGDILAKEGRFEEARESLKLGECTLRDAGDRFELAKLLCIRGRIKAALGDRASAQSALAEAETLAIAIVAGADSELTTKIAELRRLLS
jgi:predicted ATPase/class 3 adenylate cyclase/Tfp pilus assembly protein PilF